MFGGDPYEILMNILHNLSQQYNHVKPPLKWLPPKEYCMCRIWGGGGSIICYALYITKLEAKISKNIAIIIYKVTVFHIVAVKYFSFFRIWSMGGTRTYFSRIEMEQTISHVIFHDTLVLFIAFRSRL